MRIAMVMAAVVMAGCASDKLALTPPPGVDLSAHWKLNEADSDDPQRLLQSQLANATAAAGPGGSTGSGGRGGGQSGGGGGYARRPRRACDALRDSPWMRRYAGRARIWSSSKAAARSHSAPEAASGCAGRMSTGTVTGLRGMTTHPMDAEMYRRRFAVGMRERWWCSPANPKMNGRHSNYASASRTTANG